MVKNQGLTREEWINYDYKKIVTNKEVPLQKATAFSVCLVVM